MARIMHQTESRDWAVAKAYWLAAPSSCCFFLFIHYSRATYQIMARLFTVRFLSALRAVAARCKHPFALRPGLSPEDVKRAKGITKERRAKTKDKRKGKKAKDERKESQRPPYDVPAGAMKSGVGRNSGVPPSPVSSAPAPCSSRHSRTSSSDTALTASSSASAGTRLPTSVADRKSSTARLHLPSARRSRTFHRPFRLPVSFFASAHKIFCCGFHSGHSLKRWSRVCVRYRHHQHCGVDRFFVLRYCPVRQCPVLSW